MLEDALKKNKEYFQKLVDKFGSDSNYTGSYGGIPQDVRYRQLTGKGIFENADILEIGCGTGGFLEYLINNDIIKQGKYCGVDIIKKMQEINEQKFPSYRFLTMDILDEKLDRNYDVVVLCGVFNIRTDDGDSYMKNLLIKSFEYCNKVLCFNFISNHVNYVEGMMEYHNPADILDFCIEKLSPKVEMFHHYLKCDVCCHVYR